MSSNSLVRDETSRLQNIKYEILYGVDSSSYAIDSANVLTCQLTWDVNDISVVGSVIIVDTADLFTLLPPHTSMMLRISFKQYFSKNTTENVYDFEKIFSIVRIERTIRGVSKTAIVLDIIDPYYFYMSFRYKSKGYNDITFGAILKEVLGEAKIANKSLPAAVVNDQDTNILYENIVIPAHKPFLHFLYNREFYDGFSLVNKRYGFDLLNVTTYFSLIKKFDKSIAITLTTDSTKNSPFYIKEYKLLMLDSFTSNTIIPNTLVNHLNYLDKGYNQRLIYNDYISKSLKLDDMIIPGMTITDGLRLHESQSTQFTNVMMRLHGFKLLENYMIEVTVSGNVLYNLYDIIGVDINDTIKGLTTKNLLNSGKYVILKMIDKIDGIHYNQILTLGRVGIKYQEGTTI